jgi:hypothetical protein
MRAGAVAQPAIAASSRIAQHLVALRANEPPTITSGRAFAVGDRLGAELQNHLFGFFDTLGAKLTSVSPGGHGIAQLAGEIRQIVLCFNLVLTAIAKEAHHFEYS